MARSAGYNSGFAMSTSRDDLNKNPLTNSLLDSIRDWEALRMKNAFTATQRKAMRDTNREFHLSNSDGHLLLHKYKVSDVYEYSHTVRQPGEPTFAEWEYTQVGIKQPLQFTLELQGESGGAIDNIAFEIDNYISFVVPFAVEVGQTLLCDGTETLRLYDATGRQVKKYKMSDGAPVLANGPHEITFGCDFKGETTPIANVQFKSFDEGEPLRSEIP